MDRSSGLPTPAWAVKRRVQPSGEGPISGGARWGGVATRHPTRPAPSADGCFFSLAAGLAPGGGPSRLHVAFVGPENGALFEGFRLHPGSEVLILHEAAHEGCAEQARAAFAQAGVPARLRRSEGGYFGLLRALQDALHEERLAFDEVVVNAGSGTREAGCAAATAAYLHGLRAFHVENERSVELPVLGPGQRASLDERDVGLLLALAASPRGVRGLARRAGMPRDAVRVRIEGEPGRRGLAELGLVERRGPFAWLARLRLTPTGRSLVESGALSSRDPTV